MKQLNNDDVYVSASGLDAFFYCPAKYAFSREWTPKFLPAALKNGSDAHAVLAGKMQPPPTTSGLEYARALKEMEVECGYTVEKREFTQMVELAPHLYLKRIIDAVGHRAIIGFDGNHTIYPVLIDYKTSARGMWPEFDNIVPQAMGFQAVAYLIPPTDPEDFWYAEWPDQIDFLVSNQARIHRIYSYSLLNHAEDLDNFMDAAKIMGGAILKGRFPKKRGSQCASLTSDWDCPYLHLCFEAKGWEECYDRRTHNEED